MTSDRAICTIIAKNYIASARTLARSFLSVHPDQKCYVLIVDDFEDHYINPLDECFEVVTLADLDIPNLPDFCFKYNIKELCTAVKPYLIEYLLHEESVRRLLYLDPDILVTGTLAGVFEHLDTYDIVLTPHLDADYPDDDLLPDDGHILRAGQFNLGFIGVNSSDNALDFLAWWKSKLRDKCVVDLMKGYFVDQKFIDFVPIFFENYLIEKNVGYNVAYWNLHSRRISNDKGRWTCNDGPLYFFHFSGYEPNTNAISKHIPGSVARHQLSRHGDLQRLFMEYKELLLANGYEQSRLWPYTFGYFQSGENIPDELRTMYRTQPQRWAGSGDPFQSNDLKQEANRLRGTGHRENNGNLALTPDEQLNAILNSRAWRWVSRYGRLKNRYVTPVAESLRRLVGARRSATATRRKQ